MSARKIKCWRKGTEKRGQSSPRPVSVALACDQCPELLLSGTCTARHRGDGGPKGLEMGSMYNASKPLNALDFNESHRAYLTGCFTISLIMVKYTPGNYLSSHV